MNWQKDGSCAKHVDGVQVDDFYFDDGRYSKNSPQLRAAKAKVKKVCGLCPVRKECLNWAIENREREGFWGGKTTNERREHIRDQRRIERSNGVV